MMKRQDLLMCAGLLAAFAMAACGGAPPMAMQGTAEDEAAIRALPDRYVAAYNAADAAALGAMAAPNYQAVAADGTMITGPAGLEQMERAEMTMPEGMQVTLSATSQFVNWINAENAITGGTFTVSGVPEGAPDRGSWLVTVTKAADGQWLMTSSLAANFVEPPMMDAGGE